MKPWIYYINSKSMMKHTNIHIIIFQLWSLLNINQPIKLTLSTDRLTRTCDQLCRMFEHQNVTQFSLVSPYLILRLGQARVWSPIPQFQQNSLQQIVGHYMGQYGTFFFFVKWLFLFTFTFRFPTADTNIKASKHLFVCVCSAIWRKLNICQYEKESF